MPNGGYLVDLTWYAAFYRRVARGQIAPGRHDLDARAGRACMQHLAWDVVKNYPDCGLYEEGTTPVSRAGVLARRRTELPNRRRSI